MPEVKLANSPRTQAEQQSDTEAKFRRVLEDVVDVFRYLGQFCNSMDEAISMAELGTINDGQLRHILYGIHEAKAQKR